MGAFTRYGRAVLLSAVAVVGAEKHEPLPVTTDTLSVATVTLEEYKRNNGSEKADKALLLASALCLVAVCLLLLGCGLKVEKAEFIDPRDGQKYRTVKIGSLVWMAENLRYMSDGSLCYEDDDYYCRIYGRLYRWNTAMSACPEGWRLSSPADWDELSQRGLTATMLKAASGWGEGLNGTDKYGFSALPGGHINNAAGDRRYRYTGGGGCGYWWTAHYSYGAHTIYKRICSDGAGANGMSNDYGFTGNALSVRCVIPAWALEPGGAEWLAEKTAREPAPETRDTIPPTSDTIAAEPPAAPALGAFTDKRDRKAYKTVTIGGDTWMAENLNYKADSSWCYSDGYTDDSDCKEYGRLYDWETAKKVCPSGWHLPTSLEWHNLIMAAGGGKDAGRKLKSKSGWYGDGNGTDDYGFAALPGGNRVYKYYSPYSEFDGGGDFVNVNNGYYGYWWSLAVAGEQNRGGAYRLMYYKHNYVNSGSYGNATARSVRCVMNRE